LTVRLDGATFDLTQFENNYINQWIAAVFRLFFSVASVLLWDTLDGSKSFRSALFARV
jgi:hypothetical protein